MPRPNIAIRPIGLDERADWERAVVSGLDDGAVRDAYFEAIAWADQIHRDIVEMGK